jgi:hypothetical protein
MSSNLESSSGFGEDSGYKEYLLDLKDIYNRLTYHFNESIKPWWNEITCLEGIIEEMKSADVHVSENVFQELENLKSDLNEVLLSVYDPEYERSDSGFYPIWYDWYNDDSDEDTLYQVHSTLRLILSTLHRIRDIDIQIDETDSDLFMYFILYFEAELEKVRLRN